MALQQFERQKVWCAIRVFGNFSIPEIAERCQTEPMETRNYIWALRRYGYLDWQKQDKAHTEFCLIKDTGGIAPSTHAKGMKDHNIGYVYDVSQRLWNAICILNFWDLDLLASNAQAIKGSATRYTRLLVAAGYVSCEPRDSRVVGSRNRYQLIKKTGAIAPLFLDSGECFDSNLFLQELWALQSKKSKRRARA